MCRRIVPFLLILASLLMPGCHAETGQSATPILSTRPVTAAPGESSSTEEPAGTATPGCTDTPGVKGIFVEALSAGSLDCLPDGTGQAVGIYVYDLDAAQEIVAINADVPFQFASAFKGAVLVYFLDHCKHVWDSASPEWEEFFYDEVNVHGLDWYVSEEYKERLIHFSNVPSNWGSMDDFMVANQFTAVDQAGPFDQRYLILEQVYQMVVKSNNTAAGNVLQYVHEHCPFEEPPDATGLDCGEPNAINKFNGWFNTYAGIDTGGKEAGRGLMSWDVVTSMDANGSMVETRMPTYGQQDTCVTANAFLDCSEVHRTTNTWTARDLFQFYHALFHEDDDAVRETAMQMLVIDLPGSSRGYLKNMARKMGATAMSKNGYAGLVLTDAGILEFQNRTYILSTLSYNAVSSVNILYGSYDDTGDPAGGRNGLLQDLIEGNLP